MPGAQKLFRWPENPENLKVLDPGLSARELERTILFDRCLNGRQPGKGPASDREAIR